MLVLLWTIPLVPFLGFGILALFGGRFSRGGIVAIGVGSVGISTILASIVAASFLMAPPPGYSYTQTIWSWIQVGSLTPSIAFYLDALSLVFVLVITYVGFLIHLYSVRYMMGEEGYSRFFAYMNLFVGFMLTLVLANNLLLLFLGWEGVGLCSYLLIDFWYRDVNNVWAARKAFIVTRVGDTAFIVGLFLLFDSLGTLDIQPLMALASSQFAVGSGIAIASAALLLGGAVGKSAQVPLQTWLPDAMAGPTPVSALIHAATMVTAGVYLIARTHVLFSLAPPVQEAVAIIGTVTLLVAGFAAITQSDIKRMLAYSTISQIGYMFLALGVGAWTAAIFHFMIHAFFKALLFMAAGVVILGTNHQQDMFRMGGLRRDLPLAFWTFLIGAASMSALPFFTAGFYSKDTILEDVWFSPMGGAWLWGAGIAGAFLTSIYVFRAVFLTFFGRRRQPAHFVVGLVVQVPLVVLSVLSLGAGFLDMPIILGGSRVFSNFLGTALPVETVAAASPATEWGLLTFSMVVSIVGVFVAWVLYLRSPELVNAFIARPVGAALNSFLLHGLGFDWIYDRVFVRPVLWLVAVSRGDFVDVVIQVMAWVARTFNAGLSQSETGNLRWYMMGIVFGAAAVLAIGVFSS